MSHNSDASVKPHKSGKPKLDDAETIILMAAASREDGIALPVPDSIKAPAEQVARKIRRLIKLSLLQEMPAKFEDGLWRKSDDDRHLTLKITPLAFEVLGLSETMKPANPKEVEGSAGASMPAGEPIAQKAPKARRDAKPGKAVQKKPERASRQCQTSKTETLLGLLERAKGASLDDLMKVSGWQAHSVRGFLSAVVKKKLRLKLTSEEDDKGVRRYRVKPRAKA